MTVQTILWIALTEIILGLRAITLPLMPYLKEYTDTRFGWQRVPCGRGTEEYRRALWTHEIINAILMVAMAVAVYIA